MHACKRNLIALAVAAVLVPGIALADKPTGTGKGNTQSQAATTTPRPTLPTTAVDKAGDALERNPQADTSVTREVGKKAPPASDRPSASDSDDDTDVGGADTSASASSAAETNPGKGNWWADADGDSDGRLSRDEAKANAGVDTRFATIDTNADGFVTRDEYMAFYKANAAQGAEHAEDHSAVVTRDLWSRFDADADGRLSATEIELDLRLKGDFGSVDADGDGFISQDEYRGFYRGQ
jgi:hypothetical protein